MQASIRAEALSYSIKIAIQQMKLLTDDSGIKKLKDGVPANEHQYTRIKKH